MVVLRLYRRSPARAFQSLNEMVCSLGRSRMRNEMKCELCCDDNCLDLPSLTEIQGNGEWIHRYMGYVILESMI